MRHCLWNPPQPPRNPNQPQNQKHSKPHNPQAVVVHRIPLANNNYKKKKNASNPEIISSKAPNPT